MGVSTLSKVLPWLLAHPSLVCQVTHALNTCDNDEERGKGISPVDNIFSNFNVALYKNVDVTMICVIVSNDTIQISPDGKKKSSVYS